MQSLLTVLKEILHLPQHTLKYLFSVPYQAMKLFNSKNVVELQDLQSGKQSLTPLHNILDKFNDYRQLNSHKTPLRILAEFMFRQIWVYGFLVMFISLIALVVSSYLPQALKNMLDYIQGNSQYSLTYIIFMFTLFQLLDAFFNELRWSKNNIMHCNMHNFMKGIIYSKIQRLSCGTKQFMETGTTLSYWHSDVGQMGGFLHWTLFAALIPFEFTIGAYYLIREAGLMGLFGIFCLFPLIYIRRKMQQSNKELHKKKAGINDKLSKLINQYVSGIRVIKYYGWQSFVSDKIKSKRDEKYEIEEAIMKTDSINGQISAIFFNGYALVMFFISWIFTGTLPTISNYLMVTFLIRRMEGPVNNLNEVYSNYSRTEIAATKIYHFLEAQEKYNYVSEEGVQTGAIEIQGKFSWKSALAQEQEIERKTFLKEQIPKKEEIASNFETDHISIQPGELIGIVGSVGSGKSTLLSSMLGETNKLDGFVKRKGTLSYCPEVCWLKNDTIKNNILFGLQLNEQKYQHIVDISQLEGDLEILDKGDETLVGQRGIKLSGGQKQRVAIARCLYADAEINIIDDCLSALDAEVGKKIFYDCILKEMIEKGHTVIMSLNALQYLKFCSKIIFVKNSKVSTIGSYAQIKENHPEFFSQFKDFSDESYSVDKNSEETSSEKSMDEKNSEKQAKKQRQKKKQETVKIENQEQESKSIMGTAVNFFKIDWKIYDLGLFAVLAFSSILGYIKDFFIGNHEELGVEIFFFFVILTLIFGAMSCVDILKTIKLKRMVSRKAGVLAKSYIQKIFSAKLQWFDSKTMGEILERAIHYQNVAEEESFHGINNILSTFFSLLFKIIIISYVTPSALLILMLSFVALLQYNKNFSKFDAKMHEVNNTNCEKFENILQESVTGIYLIRAFNQEQKYFEAYDKLHEGLVRMHITWHHVMGGFKNFIQRSVIAFVTCALCYSIANSKNSLSHDSSSTFQTFLLSLGIFQALYITSEIGGIFGTYNWIRSMFMKIGKIISWVDSIDVERQFESPKPSIQNWLQEGRCQLQNVSYRYAEDTPVVLKNLSFSVKQGEKIGVVGRTGCGKSTLTLGLFRLLDVCENNGIGRVSFDETDISGIGLNFLRKKIVMIPQDPLLFSGTIRSNIDPMEERTDEEVADCLKKIGLWEKLSSNVSQNEEKSLKNILGLTVDEEGSNFSIGERQLMCLARAIVRKPKILVMDEATARIDLKTDAILQKIINTEFKDSTVITIAHRLNTIVKYDKILALEKGEIIEFDQPLKLLQNEDSYLAKHVKKVSDEYHQSMVELAKQK